MASIRSLVKKIAYRTLPRIYEPLKRVHHARVRQRLHNITAECIQRNVLTVLDGPFRGMKYTPEATAAHFPPKVLGAYEAELHPVLEQVIDAGYTRILDVGCSEGYYAVGLAIRCPAATVLAFDTDEASRGWCEGLAKANGVEDRVTAAGFCSPETLQSVGDERAFLLSDCEGYETDLLDLDRAPVIRNWDILVELHDDAEKRVTRTIIQRFSATHDIQEFWPDARRSQFESQLAFLSSRDRKLAASDLRGDQNHWAFMQSRRTL